MTQNDLAMIEKERLEVQGEIDQSRSQTLRNQLGQFATPPELALSIMRFVRRLSPINRSRVVFADPAFGTGAFYSAFLRTFPKSQVAGAIGIELDDEFAEAAHSLWSETGLRLIHADFTAPGALSDVPAPDLLVTNPPYIRHHHIGSARKKRLQTAIAESTGYSLSGLAGFYVYYFFHATHWLRDGGVGVWLIPSEFMDVNYGTTLKAYLLEQLTLLRIHRFDPEDVQFTDALVTSAIVVFRKAPPPRGHKVKLSLGGALARPHSEQLVPTDELSRTRKWSIFPKASGADKQVGRSKPCLTFGDLFRIQRGIATGANSIFILSRSAAREKGFSEEYLRPVLPSPRNLPSLAVESGPDGYPDIPDQLALIDCDLPECVLKRRCPSLWKYLSTFEQQGIAQRYILRHRSPWYRQEQRPAPPFLCTYISRAKNGRQSFRFILNKSQAIATNVYLMLYPRGELAALLRQQPELAESTFRLLQTVTSEDFVTESRVYGGGLHKLEPKELARVRANAFGRIVSPRKKQLRLWG